MLFQSIISSVCVPYVQFSMLNIWYFERLIFVIYIKVVWWLDTTKMILRNIKGLFCSVLPFACHPALFSPLPPFTHYWSSGHSVLISFIPRLCAHNVENIFLIKRKHGGFTWIFPKLMKYKTNIYRMKTFC